MIRQLHVATLTIVISSIQQENMSRHATLGVKRWEVDYLYAMKTSCREDAKAHTTNSA